MAISFDTVQEVVDFLWELDGEGLHISNDDLLKDKLETDYDLEPREE